MIIFEIILHNYQKNFPSKTVVSLEVCVVSAFYFGGFEWVDGGRRLSRAHIPLDERRKSLHRNSIFATDSTGKYNNTKLILTIKISEAPYTVLIVYACLPAYHLPC